MRKLNLIFFSAFFSLIIIFNRSLGSTDSSKRSSKNFFLKKNLFYGLTCFGYIFYLLNKKYKYVDLNKYFDIYLKLLQEKFQNFKNKDEKKILVSENENSDKIIFEDIIKNFSDNLKNLNLKLDELIEKNIFTNDSFEELVKNFSSKTEKLEGIKKGLKENFQILSFKLDELLEKLNISVIEEKIDSLKESVEKGFLKTKSEMVDFTNELKKRIGELNSTEKKEEIKNAEAESKEIESSEK